METNTEQSPKGKAMSPVTYEILSAIGRNVMVRFTCETASVEVGTMIPEGTPESDIDAVIRRYIPYDYFNDVLNPVADNIFANLVGKTGVIAPVTQPDAPVVAVEMQAIGDKVVSFTEAQ